MRTATGRRALYGRGGYDPCEAGVCARFPCTSQERWLAPSRRETLLLLPLVQPATVDRLQRSNFVDSTSEEVARSTPPTAPIRSASASMSPIVGTTPDAATSQMPLTACRLRTSGTCRSARTEERRVGKEGESKGRTRG